MCDFRKKLLFLIYVFRANIKIKHVSEPTATSKRKENGGFELCVYHSFSKVQTPS